MVEKRCAGTAGFPLPALDSWCYASRQEASAVFIRVKRVNGNDYVYLVENVREGGRHVQRIIKTLGRRD